jgi:multiple sugar transport system permease protein
MPKINPLILFLIPAFVVMGLFLFFPTVWGIFISFTNQTLIGPTARNFQFIGLKNFIEIFRDTYFYRSLGITFKFLIGSALIGQFLLGLFFSLYWDPRVRKAQGKWIKKIVSSSMVVSWILPPTVFAYCWIAFLNKEGIIGQSIKLFGGEPQPFLIISPLLSIIVINIARGTAWSWLLFSSSLNTIPSELFESADVDGASGLQKTLHIALPLMKGHLAINAILITLWTIAVFDFIYAITGGGPADKTMLIGIYTYQEAFKFLEIGKGAALALIVLIIDLIAAIIYLLFSRKLSKGEAI